MSTESLSGTNCSKSNAGKRRFHLWLLPSAWLVAIIGLWCNIWLRDLHGDRTMPVLIAGFAGLWLGEFFGLLPFPFVQCLGGVLVMGAVGLFQDFLGVPKRIVIFYAIVPIVSFSGLAILQGTIGNPKFLFELVLLHFCIDLYAIAFLSCIVYLLLHIGRRLAHTH